MKTEEQIKEEILNDNEKNHFPRHSDEAPHDYCARVFNNALLWVLER
jgi:hypothetical protein